MIHPDRGKVILALADDKPDLELWYPNAAVVAICDRAKFDFPLVESMRLIDEHLTSRTLPIYVWAGRLWQNREISFEEIKGRVDWSPRPTLEIVKEVRRAIILCLSGKDTKKEVEAEGPPAPTVNGTGAMPSALPSASSD